MMYYRTKEIHVIDLLVGTILSPLGLLGHPKTSSFFCSQNGGLVGKSTPHPVGLFSTHLKGPWPYTAKNVFYSFLRFSKNKSLKNSPSNGRPQVYLLPMGPTSQIIKMNRPQITGAGL